ncbi:Uncharacterised protein [Leminorella richardii]|uniref:Lipoprotein n=1 Tax=Leminorella richardii TaxID=158841 RepID=A0A2X4XSC0_9GAMM|nr:hypothetical protein [Leminorella richardii]SQI42905.1 Uncharacterised protein [Leminorella richardii]
MNKIYLLGIALLSLLAGCTADRLVGDWAIYEPGKPEGAVAIRVAPYQCERENVKECEDDKERDVMPGWRLTEIGKKGRESALIYPYDITGKEASKLNPGWQCNNDWIMCIGEPNTQPFVSTDYISQSGFVLVGPDVGILEVTPCRSVDCRQELDALKSNNNK